MEIDLSEDSFPRAKILRWFHDTARDLPWRRTYRPYEVAVSEFMLQQTQVATMLRYFEAWMKRYPDWQDLAKATDDEVRMSWQGLGYYSRSIRLRNLARSVVERGGQLSDDVIELERLPGIGSYTARAIAAIAFNKPVCPIDGNFRRVFSRFWATGERGEGMDKAIRERMERELKQCRRRRELVQAIMECGAQVCRPMNPVCEQCPLSQSCKAYAEGSTEQYPAKEKLIYTKLNIYYIWIYNAKKQVLVKQREDRGRFASMLQPPWFEFKEGEQFSEFMLQLAPECPVKEKCFRRDFTRHHVTWTGWRLNVRKKPAAFHDYQWVDARQLLKMNAVQAPLKTLQS